MLPLLVFAITAGLIFVPLTMTLVARISDQHAGIASSMFNAGQQVGGAVGLAVIGSVAWTIVNNNVRHALARVPAGHAAAPGHAALAGSPTYHHALTAGVDAALTIGAAATVVALIVTLVAIRVRREDLPASPLPA
jgi:MFS family permease